MLPRTKILNASDTSIGITQDISTRSLQTVSVGDSAGKINNGTNNAFIGVQAGAQNTTGSYVTAVGYQAAAQNTNSSYATMIGAFAGAQNLSGNEVVFTGFRAGELNRYGGQHVGIGAYALRENVSGNASVAVGYRSGERTLDGGYNTMIGAYSGQDNRSGNFNTMGGYSSGRAAFLGNENTYFGAYSGYSNSIGSANSLFGYRSGANLTAGNLNVAIGAYSLENAQNAFSNVIIGPFAGRNQTLSSINNVLIGTNVATNAEVSDSVIIGTSAAQNVIGKGLVIIGNNGANSANAAAMHGNCNILIGSGANLFSDTNIYGLPNSFGISIGNLNTLTYTNSVSIGINITNERENSVLLGNTLSSDSPQSVVIGNNISLQSVVFFKDALYYGYTTIAQQDGSNIFQITNINYTNTLISPITGIPYKNATANIINSNVINSITHPQLNTCGPFPTKNNAIHLPYDLIQNIANFNSNYAYSIGLVNPIRNVTDLAQSTANILNTNTITTLFNTNSACNIFYTTPSATNYQLSNFYYIHEFDPYIQFIPFTSNILITTPSNVLTNAPAQTITVACNLPFTPLIANITQLNPATLTAPIYIPKTVSPPVLNTNNANQNTNQNTITINTYKSLLNSPIQVFSTPLSTWQYTVNSNFGLIAPNAPTCNILYTVSKLPKYGTLNNTIYNDIYSVQNITYTPFTEYAQNTSDSFEITPIFSITDYSNCNYGLQSTSAIPFNITFNPATREVSPANLISFENNTLKTLSIKDIILNSVPAFDSTITYINVTSLDTNTILLSNQIQFTSNDIQIMNNKNTGAYPISLAPSLYNTIVNNINSAYSCDLQYYQTYILPTIQTLANNSYSLSNTLSSNVLTPRTYLQCLSNITVYSQSLINLVPLANNNTYTTVTNLNIQINTWNSYDPFLPPQYIQTTNITTSFNSFMNVYIHNNLFITWSNVNVIRPLFNASVYPFSSNVAINLNTSLANTNHIFDDSTYISSGLAAVQYTSALYTPYSTFYDKYYNSPRLFISFSDLSQGRIQLQQINNVSTANISFKFVSPTDTTSSLSIPILTYPSTNIIENNIQETINVIIPNTPVIYTSNLDNQLISNYYIQTVPQYGVLLNTTSAGIQAMGANLSNISYSVINPWAPLSSFDITIATSNTNNNTNNTNNTTKYLTKHYNYIYDTQTRTLPITIGSITPLLVQPSQNSQYLEYNVNTIYTTQSNTIITINSNQGLLTSIVTSNIPIYYNSNIGYTITTSNISLSNIYITSTVPYGTGSNIISQLIYTNYSSSNTSNNSIYNSYSFSANILSATSNILFPSILTNNITVTSNVINSIIYYAYGYDTTIVTSNQNHYDNYDINTGKYLYHSDDKIIQVINPYPSIVNFIYNQPGPQIVNYCRNVTIHYNYNRYESYQDLNRLFLFSTLPNIIYSAPSTNNIINSEISTFAPFLFINSNTSKPLTDTKISWSNTDSIYIKSLLPNIACNITIPLTPLTPLTPLASLAALTPLALNNIPAPMPVAVPSAVTPPIIGVLPITIDPNTMTSLSLANLLQNDISSLHFTPTDINFTNIMNGSIILGNNLITTAKFSSLNSCKYLASGRYDNDTLRYFYSSNGVYASSNFTKNLQINNTPSSVIQSFNIGLSTFNNTLNPFLLYYSIPSVILTSNIGIHFTSVPSGINFINITKNTTGNIFNQSDTVQFISNNNGNNGNGTASYSIVYDVIDTSTQSYTAIPGYTNKILNVQTYVHYEFPLSNVDPISLAIQNFGNGWQNAKLGTFWNKIDSLKIQGQPFNPRLLQFVVDIYPKNGYINNSLNYFDVNANSLRYVPYSQLTDISGLSNDSLRARLLYNSNQLSPEYNINIKNYISRFTPRIINASSFSNIAYPPQISYGMQSDQLQWIPQSGNIYFPKNTVETRSILWNLKNYTSTPYFFTENVATYNSTKTPSFNAAAAAAAANSSVITLTIDESDSINMSFLAKYIDINARNRNAVNNDTYFYITTQPLYGIIQDAYTGNTCARFTQDALNRIIYQHFGINRNTDIFTVAISSSPYDLSLDVLNINIEINTMPTVINNYSQYIFIATASNALPPHSINIPHSSLETDTGYIHIFKNSLSNICISSNLVNYSDTINFQFNKDYILNSNAPYPQYGFDFSYNNSSNVNYINRLSYIPEYTGLYRNHFNGYFNQNTDINNIITTANNIPIINNNQVISYTITPNPQLFGDNIFSTLIQFQTNMSLETSQLEFLYNNKFLVTFYAGNMVLQFTFTRYTWNLTINNPGSPMITVDGYHSEVINNSLVTLLIVNYDNFNNNYLSLYWDYNINSGTNNINLLKGLNIYVDLSQLNKVEISVPIQDPLNYISTSNFVRKIDGGDLNASYTLQNYNVSHVFQNLELYVGNLASTDTHNVILGKAINVRGTNNICIGNTFSTSGDASLIIGNNIGGGGINEVNKSIIIGNNSFANSAVYNIISIGNSNLNYLRQNYNDTTNQYVNNFLSQYPILIGNSIDISKIDFSINIGNVFLKTSFNPDTTLNNQIYLGTSGEKVGIGYQSNVGLTKSLSINGDLDVNGTINAQTINFKNFTISSLIDTVPSISAKSIDGVQLNYVVSSVGTYDSNGILNVRKSIHNDYSVIGICLQINNNDPSGSNIIVGVSGHTKVWCNSKVTVGDLLAADSYGLAYSAGKQFINQTVNTTVQQNYTVKKVVNGVPIFTQSTQDTNTNTNANTNTNTTNLTTEVISNYTFAKATTSWDPADTTTSVPWIDTTYDPTSGQRIGLIGCILFY